MSHTDEPGCFPSSAIWGSVDTTYTNPTALPLGVWHVMSNGRIHFLNIISVSGSTVTGKYEGEDIREAEWDAATRKLTFVRQVSGIGLRQAFTGYLMSYLEPDPKWRIAGVFQNEQKDDPIVLAGWYATLPRTKQTHVSS